MLGPGCVGNADVCSLLGPGCVGSADEGLQAAWAGRGPGTGQKSHFFLDFQSGKFSGFSGEEVLDGAPKISKIPLLSLKFLFSLAEADQRLFNVFKSVGFDV